MNRKKLALVMLGAFFIVIIAVPMMAQQWSTPILVASGDTPDLDIDPITGNLYLLSMKSGVKITKVSPDGKILEQENVPGAESEEGGGHFGASIAVDSKGYPHVCYRFYEGPDDDNAPLYSAFYIKKTATGWQNKIKLSEHVRRGYVVRIDVDEKDIAHIVQGFVLEEIWGRVRYFRVVDNRIDKQEVLGTDYAYIYRGDDRIEITSRPGGHLHIVSGVPNPKGPLYYLVSHNRGDNFTNLGDIRSSQCTDQSRTGSPDLGVDSSGSVHICYGFSQDLTRGEQPSVRYARFVKDKKVSDVVATPKDYLIEWENASIGLGSIAGSDNGQVIVIAFLEQPGGKLYTTTSQDTGKTWDRPMEIDSASGSNEGRNKHFIRSKRNKFYLVYPSSSNVYLRILTIPMNDRPIADAGGPYSTTEGKVVHFEASKSYDPDGSIVKYEWDWQNNDGYDASSTASFYDYTYFDNFTGQVKLRVTDNKGETATDLANVTVTNVSPTANAGGPYQGSPNQNIPCHGSATDPGLNDVLTYTWDLDFDGLYETIGQNVSVQFSRGGIYNIVLRVSDDDGGAGVDTTAVTIYSEPPDVSSIPSQTVDEGSLFSPIPLDNYVSDPDNRDDQLTWQVHGQKNLKVSIDANRVATISSMDKDWYGSENLTFVAIDPSQLKDSTTTTFTIRNVNDPPVISSIGNQTTNEGERFTALNLDNYVTDPDNRDDEITWKVTENVQLGYELNHRALTVFPLHSEWSGNERLSLIATDPGGLSDTVKVFFIVNPINDPPVVSEIPGQQKRVGQDFTPITLDNYVSDIDNRDDEMKWSYKGNKNLMISITNRIVSITRPHSNWVGSDTITFIARDPAGASDSSRSAFTSLRSNQRPVVSKIQDQTILEGQTFQPIFLDGYVTDPDNNDAEITWHIYGYKDLLVKIENRIVTIQPPDDNWNGLEIINFKAVDPEGLADSSLTLFAVQAVNDPPVLAPLPDFQCLEDDTLKWTFAYLRSLVVDPDNKPTDLKFQISNNVNLSWLTNTQKEQIFIFGQTNWYGEETITVTVFDGRGGTDSRPCKITVRSVPDTPMPFSIIYPRGQIFSAAGDTIKFLWYQAFDPEGGRTMYQLNISDGNSFQHVIDQYNNLLDTSFVYITHPDLKGSMYYWKIVAFNSVGFTGSNVGQFRITISGVEEGKPGVVPNDYALLQNFPNPFNPETSIVYQLPRPSLVTLEIYNDLGQRVALLEHSEKPAGTHKVRWNVINNLGQRLPSSVYICRLKADDRIFDMKMVLLQ